MLDELMLWIDPVKRPGPEAMAVDEWLLETAAAPVLRVSPPSVLPKAWAPSCVPSIPARKYASR